MVCVNGFCVFIHMDYEIDCNELTNLLIFKLLTFYFYSLKFEPSYRYQAYITYISKQYKH